MAAFIDPGSDSTVIQTAQPGTRSAHHRPHEQKVYTFEEYETLMRKSVYDSKDKIRQKLKQHLKGKLQNVSDQIINELVTNILDPKRNVKLYSNHYSALDYDDICREYKTRYNKIKECNFLLIIAPTKSENFDVHEDSQLREEQYKRMFKDIKDRDSLTTVKVTTFAELECAVQQFINLIAKDALHAYIVFNGHGSSDGLVLKDEERCYNLDGFLRFVERCFDDVDSQDPFHLPARVLVVFGQCYGHLHDSSVNNSRFRVHSFTNPDSCETQFYVNISETRNVNSIHVQLQTFIHDTMKFHGSRDVETDEPSCLASARVSPLSHMVSEYSSRLNITSSDQMELSDSGISLSSSRASFLSDGWDSSLALAVSGIENMEIDNDSAFSKDITKRMQSKVISRRQQKNP